MDLPIRKRNRLDEWNYGNNGGYFLTLCVQNRMRILSRIDVGDGSPVPLDESDMPFAILTCYGKIVDDYIRRIPEKYPCIRIENYVVMPNHIHILAIVDNGVIGTGDPSPTIGQMMAWFKYQTTKEINAVRNMPGQKVWQRSYHDHIIRGLQDYFEIMTYIDENPLRWNKDCYY